MRFIIKKTHNLALILVIIIPHCRWQKCMGQVSGTDNRPKELGTTGIIVLNKCVMGQCDCPAVLKEAAEKKERAKENKSSSRSKTRSKNNGSSSTRQSNKASSSSSRFRPVIRNNLSLRGRISSRIPTTTTTTTRRPLLRGKLASRFK